MGSPHRRLLLILVALLLAGGVHRGAAQATDEGDAAAMRALAKSLGADRDLGWTAPADPCSWTGVTCISGRVTAIQVGNRSLAGAVPTEIRNLTSLLWLELHNNQLFGHLPSLVGLSSLQTLLLHGNIFSDVVPTDFFIGPRVISTSLKDAGALVNFSANSANIFDELPDFLATAFPSLDNVALAFNLLFGPVPATFTTTFLAY